MLKVQQLDSLSTSCRDFSNINQSDNRIQSHEDNGEYNCFLSYFELYDDNIYDLLTPSIVGSRGSSLSMVQDERKRYYINGLKSIMVSNLNHALETYSFGWRNLQKNIQETGLNANSSRSHSFFTISLIKRNAVPQHKLAGWPGHVYAIQEYVGGLILNVDTSHRALRQKTVHEMIYELFIRDCATFTSEASKLLVGAITIIVATESMISTFLKQ